MRVWKNKKFYIQTIITFALIVLIDWLLASGYKLFEGQSFTQTTEHYKIHFTYLGVSAAIIYSKLARNE